MWHIPEQVDWAKLDKYEGVAGGVYNRIKTQVFVFDQMINCEIYVSTTTAKGYPRQGYQEGILRAVSVQNDRIQSEQDYFNSNSDLVQYHELFQKENETTFKNWIVELRSWLNAERI